MQFPDHSRKGLRLSNAHGRLPRRASPWPVAACCSAMMTVAAALWLAECADATMQVIDNAAAPHVVTGTFTAPDEIVFLNRVKPWSNNPLDPLQGLHFRNGQLNQISGVVRPESNDNPSQSTEFHSPVIGVDGLGTVVSLSGLLRADRINQFAVLALTNDGRFVVEDSAQIDFIQDPTDPQFPSAAYFTRQWWVWGDGSGELELRPGFIADRTQNATVAEGLGSIRLSNAVLTTHHSQSLPQAKRPLHQVQSATHTNGHLVFENDPGSLWRVVSNDQSYDGATWIGTDATIDTETNLAHTGTYVTSTYNGTHSIYNQFQTTAADVAITKIGAGRLSLLGDQGYNPNSSLLIKEGAVEFLTDPFGQHPIRSGTNGQHLSVALSGLSSAVFAAPESRIAGMTLSDSSTVRIEQGAIVNSLSSVTMHGGALTGDGVLVANLVNEAGLVSPGDGIGHLRVTGQYTQHGDGVLAIEFAGFGESDQFSISESALLGGTLLVSLGEQYVPMPGDSATILLTSERHGQFSQLQMQDPLPSGMRWDLLYDQYSVRLRIAETIPGDFNSDGRVNLADYTVWRDGLGASYSPSDYSVWKTHFGKVMGSGEAASRTEIPEPSSGLIVCCLLGCVGWYFVPTWRHSGRATSTASQLACGLHASTGKLASVGGVPKILCTNDLQRPEENDLGPARPIHLPSCIK